MRKIIFCLFVFIAFISDALARSPERRQAVIPAEAEIQSFKLITNPLDPGFRRGDDFLRLHLSDTAIANEEMRNALTIKITDVSVTATVSVEVINTAKLPVKIWRDGNSWGAALWRLFLIRNGHIETYYENPNQAFTVNMRSYRKIISGESFVLKLDLNKDKWCGMGYCPRFGEHGIRDKSINFKAGDIIIVSYDVPKTIDAVDLGVWYGVVSAITTVK